MTLLAVDPGLNNGFAVIADNGDLLIASEFPQLGDGTQKRLGLAGIGDLIRQFRVNRAVIENVGSMSRQGSSTTFRFGRATGSIEGALMALGVPLAFTRPPVWKKHLGTAGKTATGLRALAAQRWPRHQNLFILVKHEHRAAAALLGLFWLQKNGQANSTRAAGGAICSIGARFSSACTSSRSDCRACTVTGGSASARARTRASPGSSSTANSTDRRRSTAST